MNVDDWYRGLKEIADKKAKIDAMLLYPFGKERDEAEARLAIKYLLEFVNPPYRTASTSP